MEVTILTPTYNRANLLERLYNSLKNQTNYNFEWLIIDDGSNDNTKQIVQEFIKENILNINYVFQNNSGKHRALNKGIRIAKADLIFIVDSDDYLTANAIERIHYYYERYKNDEKICCFSFLRCYPNGDINGDYYEKSDFVGNYIEERINKHNRGDKAEVYIAKYLKKIPFLEIENEKFLVESYVWIQLGTKYQTVYINEAIYVGDYLDDGLTKNIYKIRYNNPKGMIETCRVALKTNLNLKSKIKFMVKYIAYSIIDNRSIFEQYKTIDKNAIFIYSYLLGVLYYLYIIVKIKGAKYEKS